MSICIEHAPMTSPPQQYCNNEFQPAPVSTLEHYEEGPQVYNASGLEFDLSQQPALELAYSERVKRDLRHAKILSHKTPSHKTNGRLRGMRRSAFVLLVALITAIIVTAVIGGTVGSLTRKQKADSRVEATHASGINTGTVIVSRATVFAQQSVSGTTTPSASSFSSTTRSSSSSSSPVSSSASSSTPNEGTPIITLGPSETYSIISSPTLTLSRDCPGSNGTTLITNGIPHQYFIKNCGWLYAHHEPSGDAFQAVATTLDACIALCAAYNAINGTGPFGYCSAVEWRTDMSRKFAGRCFGNFDARAGDGGPAIGGKNAPADAAFFLGWS